MSAIPSAEISTRSLAPKKDPSGPDAQRLVTDWLKRYLGELLNLEVNTLDVDKSFARYGLDSSAAIGLTGDLSKWLGVEIQETMTYDHPTIRELTIALLNEGETLRAACAKLP
jgi:acyl carrier protein